MPASCLRFGSTSYRGPLGMGSNRSRCPGSAAGAVRLHGGAIISERRCRAAPRLLPLLLREGCGDRWRRYPVPRGRTPLAVARAPIHALPRQEAGKLISKILIGRRPGYAESSAQEGIMLSHPLRVDPHVDEDRMRIKGAAELDCKFRGACPIPCICGPTFRGLGPRRRKSI
jgi:hypothetical protein